MKNVIKILKISLILILILGNLTTVRASKIIDGLGGWLVGDYSLGEWLLSDKQTTMDTDISIGEGAGYGAMMANKGIIEIFLGIAQVIGSIVSVIALVVIGLRYMFSSVQEKAEMKGVLIYYVIGAVLVFATSNILGIVYDVIAGLN